MRLLWKGKSEYLPSKGPGGQCYFKLTHSKDKKGKQGSEPAPKKVPAPVPDKPEEGTPETITINGEPISEDLLYEIYKFSNAEYWPIEKYGFSKEQAAIEKENNDRKVERLIKGHGFKARADKELAEFKQGAGEK